MNRRIQEIIRPTGRSPSSSAEETTRAGLWQESTESSDNLPRPKFGQALKQALILDM
ncbi:hypothetical protein ACMYZ5_03135 [Bacteroides sp. KG68]|uniref:hypothetical protein n=1 Tax=Bacteroides sp. KG68 TaxID=3397824 RepID=UPI003D952EE1